jgi:hypothetical protein
MSPYFAHLHRITTYEPADNLTIANNESLLKLMIYVER